MDVDDLNLPPAIEAWVRQLLDPEFVALMRMQPYDRVDIRLSASKNRVSRLPQVVFNGGVLEWCEP